MVKKKFNGIIFILMILTGFFTVLSPTFAAGLIATPPSFNTSLQPSQVFTGTITLNNVGSDPVQVEVIPQREQSDGIHLIFSDTGIAQWIKVAPNNFTMNPGESKTITVTVRAPATINYNDAFGVVLIKGTPTNAPGFSGGNATQVMVKQGIELGIPVIVGMPGPIVEDLQLQDHKVPWVLLNFMKGKFEYNVNNTGTVKEKATGNVHLDGWFQDHDIPLNSTEIFPGDNYHLQGTWEPGITDLGLYKVETTVNYGQFTPKNVVSNGWIFVFPVWLIVIIVLIVTIWILRGKGFHINAGFDKKE